jgi:DNA-binding NarL/FixJ family response regulator
MRILLVEENPGDAGLIGKLLREVPGRKDDLTVLTRLSEAEDWLGRESHPDLILLDLGFPDAVGFEAVPRIVQLAPSVPVVVLTGRADEEVSLRSVREGAQDYLLKGDLTPVVLDRAIRYAIERNRMQNNERFLTKVRTLLSSTLDYDDVIRKLAELAVRSLGEHCCIDMVTEDGTLRRLGVAHRMPLPDELGEALRRYPVRLDRGYFQNLRESRRPVRVETVTTADLEMLSHDAEHLRLLQQLRPRSLVVVPLFAGEEFIGMMTFVSASRSFDEDDEALAEKIGLIAVPGLVNSRLYERARGWNRWPMEEPIGYQATMRVGAPFGDSPNAKMLFRGIPVGLSTRLVNPVYITRFPGLLMTRTMSICPSSTSKV